MNLVNIFLLFAFLFIQYSLAVPMDRVEKAVNYYLGTQNPRENNKRFIQNSCVTHRDQEKLKDSFPMKIISLETGSCSIG